MTIATTPAATPAARGRRPLTGWRLVLDLFKLRIGFAIGLTALAGIMAAPGALSFGSGLLLVLGVTLASAAAGAFNQYVERDIDATMARTRRRAFATGRFTPGPQWLTTIAAVGAAGVAIAWAGGNGLAAFYTFAGAFTYGVVYTVWLKRRTWWNIVVGGLAGSFAILAGAAAVDPAVGPAGLALAVALFLWTPPHFWSLSIAFRDDYAAAGVPMLPVVVGNARGARAVLTSSALLATSTLAPAFLGLSWLYLGCAIVGGTLLVWRSAQLALDATRARAMASFRASLVQLTLLLVGTILDPLLLHA